MAFLALEDIEKSYSDGTEALRGVSFSVEKGEFVAIMGPSGSGKSTLLHVLGFLDRQTKGHYRFDSKSIDDYTSEELAHVRNKRMGFVFQAFNLLAKTSVLENVQLPLLYSNVKESDRKALAEKSIAAVGLLPRVHHNPSQLSGGERQRVAIARALVNNPDVIFADEPTGNLDSVSGKVVMDIIKELHEQGRTIILITHEAYTADRAQRIIRMLDGKIESDSK